MEKNKDFSEISSLVELMGNNVVGYKAPGFSQVVSFKWRLGKKTHDVIFFIIKGCLRGQVNGSLFSEVALDKLELYVYDKLKSVKPDTSGIVDVELVCPYEVILMLTPVFIFLFKGDFTNPDGSPLLDDLTELLGFLDGFFGRVKVVK
jgi:hypothetical protein